MLKDVGVFGDIINLMLKGELKPADIWKYPKGAKEILEGLSKTFKANPYVIGLVSLEIFMITTLNKWHLERVKTVKIELKRM